MKNRTASHERLARLLVTALFGTMLLLGDLLLEALPNIHLVGVLTVVVTAVYRRFALVSVYVYVFLTGLIYGFPLWWIPYLYIWTVLWGLAMLVPRRLPIGWQLTLYVAVCALHGYAFGLLYAPGQALLFGLNWQGTLAWIAWGFITADVIHGTANLVGGILLIPALVPTLRKLVQKIY